MKISKSGMALTPSGNNLFLKLTEKLWIKNLIFLYFSSKKNVCGQ